MHLRVMRCYGPYWKSKIALQVPHPETLSPTYVYATRDYMNILHSFQKKQLMLDFSFGDCGTIIYFGFYREDYCVAKDLGNSQSFFEEK